MMKTTNMKFKAGTAALILGVTIFKMIPFSIIDASEGGSVATVGIEAVDLYVSNTYATAGSVASVSINIDKIDEPWRSASIAMKYDTALTPLLNQKGKTQYDVGEAVSGMSTASSINQNLGLVSLSCAGAQTANINGEMATFYFQLPENAEAGEVYEFTLSASTFETTLPNTLGFTALPYNTVEGTVTVSALNCDSYAFDAAKRTMQLEIETAEEVIWSSSDETVAIVDETGLVTSQLPGSATVTAKVGEREYPCEITVAYDVAERRGKLDGDNAVTASDAVIIMRAFSEYMVTDEMNLNPADFEFADINDDGKVDANDATLVLKYYAADLSGQPLTWDDFLKK